MARWLYRPTERPDPAVWDLHAEGKVFEDDALEAALSDGWFLHPNVFPAETEGGTKPMPPPDAEGDPQALKRRGRPPKEG